MAGAAPQSHPARERRVLVLGMGATGASCARHLAARGIDAWFADTRRTPPAVEAIRAAMPAAGLLTGSVPAVVPPGVARIVVSPGADLGQPLLDDARRRGIPVLGDFDLFVAEHDEPLLGITGSNGKSTVTTMAALMLQACGWPVAVGGNLGTPALDLPERDMRAYVLELSSFQLERNAPLPLAAGVLLNLAADHLDRHGSLEAYTAAKARIYARCATAVVNRDEPALAALVPAGTQRCSFGLDSPEPGHFGLVDDGAGAWLAFGAQCLLPVTALGVQGRHNVSNALAALALVHALGADLEAAADALRGFHGLAHRMQLVAREEGISWIDDSKATNVAAAVNAIRSVDGALVLIAGGDGKGQAFDELAAALRPLAASVILLGADKERMAAALADACEVELADAMPAAVARARELARPGTTVLLAPACSSLDMYSGFAERGAAFAAAVRTVLS